MKEFALDGGNYVLRTPAEKWTELDIQDILKENELARVDIDYSKGKAVAKLFDEEEEDGELDFGIKRERSRDRGNDRGRGRESKRDY